ncbi:Phage virion morphogenesis family protein [Tepidimonas fonticaldi]|uniref:Phage virion morphogenesis family protein n=1 Tax=Tepidimonas fonticaldi TaxID=1101373 RepID=A0A554XMM7_9BURK|nr:phage virion morphogenesis protein [Tepidimonas fonticaldi]TSE37081.1 Phage virion morphogenesis family protein [Tepidimonas fonticaldi]
MIRIDIDDREVRQALENLQRRVSDLTPVMHDIGQVLVEGMRARLRDSRDVEGRPFAPNSPVTLARKKGARPLVDSGMMASQFAYQAGRDTSDYRLLPRIIDAARMEDAGVTDTGR